MNLAILLFQSQRADEAEYHFERALHYRPNYSLAHLNYALMLQKLNRTSEAALHLKQAGR
jgi:predicted Zn-dependent protease